MTFASAMAAYIEARAAYEAAIVAGSGELEGE